jgi:GMP synthase (glutamine-hydrolysing)
MSRIVIPVVDVKGQYNHLITRVLSEIGAESKLVPISITKNELIKMNARGLVMGGGPQRIGSEIKKLSTLPELIKELDIPILGLCLTHQLIAIVFGGRAGEAKFPEYGPVEIFVDKKDEILKGFPKKFIAWESHNDEVLTLPNNFEILAHSKKCKIQVMRHLEKPIFGVQFHPEVIHTENGELLFKNFFNICKNY